MLISKTYIKGYRNLKEVNVEFNRLTILIGENNSGKSNLLRAITLPFFNDEIGNVNKNLGWNDINNDLKKTYFKYISENIENIRNDNIDMVKFEEIIPKVIVDVIFKPDGADEYYVRKWLKSLDNDANEYSIRYIYSIEDSKSLFELVKSIITTNNNYKIEEIKMNLLPIELYKYKIVNPTTNENISYNDLLNFRYNSLAAERDEFSNSNTNMGSKALVKLLHDKLTNSQKVKVELSYERFFKELKDVSDLDNIFNWQETSKLYNASEFFEKIRLLPNMPNINSLLNNVRLGYGEDYLCNQGLGYRNLVYVLVILNSLKVSNELTLNILTIEEPEAHLCINNIKLLSSYINYLVKSDNKSQVFISTHNSEFLDKLKLSNVTVLAQGTAYSLRAVLKKEEIDYLAKNPNMDFIKLLFSKRCILVEGPSEELLIKSYLNLQNDKLNDIEVISFHKGYIPIIKIWLKVNNGTSHRLGIIRDYDNQPKAQSEHEKYNAYRNIFVTTTTKYTLEPEFISQGSNFEKLKNYFENTHGWQEIDTPDKLSDRWQSSKSNTMLKFCYDFGQDSLEGIELPQHIQKVLNFLQSGEKK